MSVRRRRSVGVVAWSVLLAACSAVPDVVFVDPDAGGPRADAGVDAASSPDAADDAGVDAAIVPSDAGCEREANEVCCGSSACGKRECEGPGNALRCGACAWGCPGQRCCPAGPSVRCVAVDDDCKE